MTEYRNQLEDREYDALMAAAPDLLAACEAIVAADQAGNFNMLATATELAARAIAKARGGGEC